MLGLFVAIFFTLFLEQSLASRHFYVHFRCGGVGVHDEFTSSSLRDF
jgi:hypothetical protein